MKSRPSAEPRTVSSSAKPALASQLQHAKRLADATRKAADVAKASYKRVRKAHKDAKRAAKEAKKKFKALKKFVARASAPKPVSALPKKRPASTKKVFNVIKPLKARAPKRKTYQAPADLSEALPASPTEGETQTPAAIAPPSSPSPLLPVATPNALD